MRPAAEHLLLRSCALDACSDVTSLKMEETDPTVTLLRLSLGAALGLLPEIFALYFLLNSC